VATLVVLAGPGWLCPQPEGRGVPAVTVDPAGCRNSQLVSTDSTRQSCGCFVGGGTPPSGLRAVPPGGPELDGWGQSHQVSSRSPWSKRTTCRPHGCCSRAWPVQLSTRDSCWEVGGGPGSCPSPPQAQGAVFHFPWRWHNGAPDRCQSHSLRSPCARLCPSPRLSPSLVPLGLACIVKWLSASHHFQPAQSIGPQMH
jgi:hypothetical protein